jgi:hypothetical protein
VGEATPQHSAKAKDIDMQEPLEQLLADLRAAIDEGGDRTANREEIARLAGAVERRLRDEDTEGVVDDLREEVTRFEVSHPALANAIGRAADALSAIGL